MTNNQLYFPPDEDGYITSDKGAFCPYCKTKCYPKLTEWRVRRVKCLTCKESFDVAFRKIHTITKPGVRDKL